MGNTKQSLLSNAAVVGIGRTGYSRASGRSPAALAAEAVRDALDDCGLTPADVDGMTCYGGNASPYQISYAIGQDSLSWVADVNGGGNVVSAVVANAAAAIATGQCEVAVVYRVLGSETRYGANTEAVHVHGAQQFAGPNGLIVPPQWFALYAQRHMAVYGTDHEDLGAIAVQQRAHASKNPHAIARDPITIEDYLNGRWVCEPFRVFDCCYEVDGAVALVLTSDERARDLPHRPIHPLGVADGSGCGGVAEYWDDMTTMYSRNCAPRLWNRTGLQPSDIDVALMYDCFTFTVMATFEDFGFCPKGEVGDYFREGRATYGGDVVVNPHGGLLSEGYLHGLNHHYEAVLQLRGEAADRQVRDAEVALVTAGAGPYGCALVYGVDKA
jgi:acetyl-CoA acetyltransferase